MIQAMSTSKSTMLPSQLIAFSSCFDPDDGAAEVFGVIGEALDDTLQLF